MTIARVQHIYHGISNLPRDRYITTWHFESADALDNTEAGLLVAAVESFYAVATGQTKAMLHYHGFPSFRPAHSGYKVYNMSDPAPRAPVRDSPPAVQSATNLAPQLPGEVAVCLSYSAALVAGRNPARARGRVYMGPLNTNALAQAADGHARPDPAMRSDMMIAAQRMRATALAAGWTWCVYSPTLAALPVDPLNLDLEPASTPIATVSVDDAFDTQRRRGIAPLARTTLPVV